MDIYHIWADLKDGHDAKTFADDLNAYLGHLRDRGLIERWRAEGAAPNFVCTIKFQGSDEHEAARAFAAIPGARLLHLHHNKHELTFLLERG